MKCFFGHKWSRWFAYEVSYGGYFSADLRQQRHCIVCGKVEDQYLGNGRVRKVGE